MTNHSAWKNPSDAKIHSILQATKTIAVVGCSPNPERTSHQIAAFLIEKGYHVIPVHPNAETILGQKVYPKLADIPIAIDIVNVFRKAEFTPAIAEEAAMIHAKTLWLQQGIINEKTWNIARTNGLTCVMDQCIAVMHRLLIH